MTFQTFTKRPILSKVHKKCFIRSSVCRLALIRSALESSDLCASDGGSNSIFRHFGTDMTAFEVAGWSKNSNLSKEISFAGGPCEGAFFAHTKCAERWFLLLPCVIISPRGHFVESPWASEVWWIFCSNSQNLSG